MKTTKKVLHELPFAYSILVYESKRGKRVIAATQGRMEPGQTGCISFNALDGSALETVWSTPGGTMTIVSINESEEFFVTHEFYRGFEARKAKVVHVKRNDDGTYTCNNYIDIPFLHRFCVMTVEDEKWIVGATLCDDKDNRDDWSKAGRIYAGRLEYPKPCDFKEIKGGIFKNHGLYHGPHNQKPQVAIFSGIEGAFEVIPPVKKNGDWKVEQLLQFEISEIRVFDFDGDGVDELVTIECFHGDRLNIYKKTDTGYEKVYSYPVAFGHAIWCGKIFGRPSILIGYNQANVALYLLTLKKVSPFSMEVTMLDELEGYQNLDVWDDGKYFRIYTAGASGKIIMYTLEE